MFRYEIINQIIRSKGYNSYLEIGVGSGDCIKKIRCSHKTGVDPEPTSASTTHVMTSDQFFENLGSQRFDLIFIDSVHLDHQVDRDIENSLKHLAENGCIVLHDCNPPSELHAGETPIFDSWNGTVYKSLIRVRLQRSDLRLITVDTDWGVGIITRDRSTCIETLENESLTWNYFEKNRASVLGLISIAQFNALYPLHDFCGFGNSETTTSFKVLENPHWKHYDGELGFGELEPYNFLRCSQLISTYTGSRIVIEVFRGISVVGFLGGIPTFPPVAEFVVNGRLLGRARQAFESTESLLLLPGRHVLEINNESNHTGHAIWGFDPDGRLLDPPKHYVAIGAICKDENSYLAEWIRHHLAIGVSHIFLLDHGSTVPLRETIEAERLQEWVTVEECVGVGNSSQNEAHNYLVRKYRADCFWMALIDVDEFIVPKITNSLPLYLLSFEDYGCVRVSWMMFGSSGRKAKPDRQLGEFKNCYVDQHVKLIVRPKYVDRIAHAHYVELIPGARSVDENFSTNGSCNVRNIQLNHYWTRSEAEWNDKIERGQVCPSYVRTLDDFQEHQARCIFRDSSIELLWERNHANIEVIERPSIVGFIHVAAVNHWEAILSSQLSKAARSGLLNRSDSVKVSIVGAPADFPHRLLSWLPEKVEVVSCLRYLQHFEFPTLALLQNECIENDRYIWYVHSKGVTNISDGQNDWRARMEEFVLVHHELAISRLDDGYSAAGGEGCLNPFWHIPGNFWWARGEHIRALPRIDTLNLGNRWDAERWIGMNGMSNMYLHNFGDTRFREFRIRSSSTGAGIATTGHYHGWGHIPFLDGDDLPSSHYRISAHVPSLLKIEVLHAIEVFGFVSGSSDVSGWTVSFLVNGKMVGELAEAHRYTDRIRLAPGLHTLEVVLTSGEMWGAHTAWGFRKKQVGA